MSEPVWIEARDALALRERLLALAGGAEGVRDSGLLQSALARPRQISAYAEADIVALAAAYTAGIIRNHPFIETNAPVSSSASSSSK